MVSRGACWSLIVAVLATGCDGCGGSSDAAPPNDVTPTAVVEPAAEPSTPEPTDAPEPEPATEETTPAEPEEAQEGEPEEPALWQDSADERGNPEEGASYSVWREKAAKEIDADNAHAELNRLEKQINLEREKLKKEARR